MRLAAERDPQRDEVAIDLGHWMVHGPKAIQSGAPQAVAALMRYTEQLAKGAQGTAASISRVAKPFVTTQVTTPRRGKPTGHGMTAES
jgi:hypothetical protein